MIDHCLRHCYRVPALSTTIRQRNVGMADMIDDRTNEQRGDRTRHKPSHHRRLNAIFLEPQPRSYSCTGIRRIWEAWKRYIVLGFHFYPINDGRQHDVSDSLRLRVRSVARSTRGVKLKTDTSIPHDENCIPEKTSCFVP
jgi:hypothetical protein